MDARAESDLRAAVTAAVAAEDPEGLLDIGAPADEYDPEVDDLVRLVAEGRVTTDRVVEIWEAWFGPGSALARRPEAAERLAGRLRQLQGGSNGS